MGKMRLQIDCEFPQTAIKKSNKEFDVDMYSTDLRSGKAFAAEQKIRELKNCCWEVNVFKNRSINRFNQII